MWQISELFGSPACKEAERLTVCMLLNYMLCIVNLTSQEKVRKWEPFSTVFMHVL